MTIAVITLVMLAMDSCSNVLETLPMRCTPTPAEPSMGHEGSAGAAAVTETGVLVTVGAKFVSGNSNVAPT